LYSCFTVYNTLSVHVFTSREHSAWMIGLFYTPGLSNNPRFFIAWTYDSV
jgi:hypothetical protein